MLIHNPAGFFACRFFIGMIMGGFIPDTFLYLSYFYKKSEMPMRLALFLFVDSMSAFAGFFIAYRVLHRRGVQGKAGWSWLFLFETLISFAIGVASFLFHYQVHRRNKIGGVKRDTLLKGKKITVNRVLRADPSK